MEKKLLVAISSRIRTKYPHLPKGKVWQKNDQHRIYFNVEGSRELMFYVSFYKVTNVMKFTVHDFTHKTEQQFKISLESLKSEITEILDRSLKGYNKTEDLKESHQMRFPDPETYYKLRKRVKAAGFNNYKTYIQAKEQGFKSFDTYELANSFEFSKNEFDTYSKQFKSSEYQNLEEFLSAIKLKIPSYKDYTQYFEEIRKYGFPDFPTYVRHIDTIKNFGYPDYQSYLIFHEELTGGKHSNFYPFMRAYEAGFTSKSQFDDATSYKIPTVDEYNTHFTKMKEMGFTVYPDYLSAMKGKFENYAQYNDARSNDIHSKKHYLDLLPLIEEMREKGFTKLSIYKKATEFGIETYEEYKLKRGKQCISCGTYTSIRTIECDNCHSKKFKKTH